MSRYIEGVIYPVTPLHVASFEKGKGSNTLATSMRVFTQEGAVRVPYFPGSDLRGRMRRRAADEIMSRVKPVSLPMFHLLTCGSASASPDSGGTESISLLTESRDDLYLGLFGGGPRLSRSGMSVRSVIPITQATAELGMVPEDIANRLAHVYVEHDKQGNAIHRSMPNILDTHTFTKVDDVLRCDNMRAPELIANYKKDALAYASSTLDVSAQRKEHAQAVKDNKTAKAQGDIGAVVELGDKPTKTDNANIFSVDAIRPGTPMYLRIDFQDHLSDAQVYLALHCLAEVMNTHIGGWGRIGFGVVRPSDMRLVTNGSSISMINTAEGKYAVSESVPGGEECFEALDAYTHESLDRLLMPKAMKEETQKAVK